MYAYSCLYVSMYVCLYDMYTCVCVCVCVCDVYILCHLYFDSVHEVMVMHAVVLV